VPRRRVPSLFVFAAAGIVSCRGVTAPDEPQFTKDVVVTPLALPEAYRYPVPVGEEWVDPQTGSVLGTIEGWAEDDPPLLADAEAGTYRTRTREIDARTRASRVAPTLPRRAAEVASEGRQVHHDGFVARIVRRERGFALEGHDESDVNKRFFLTLPEGETPDREWWRIEALAGYLHATFEGWRQEPASLLVDRTGTIAYRFSRELVVAAEVRGSRLLALTTKRVALFQRDGSTVWSSSEGRVPDYRRHTSGDIVVLPGGDVLAWSYGRSSSRPTLLTRVRSRDGHVIWRRDAIGPALTDHSLYSKTTHVEVRGDWALIADVESSGRFLEVLALETGAVLRTWKLPRR
jgi:hypothetical protein